MNYYRNNRILTDDEEVKNSLSSRDIEEINSIKRKTVKDKEVRQAIKDQKDIQSQDRIEDIQRETLEQAEENEYLLNKMQNVKIECQNAKMKRYSSFIDKVNDNQEKEIDTYLKTGKKFRKRSRVCAIITAITSVVGAFIQQVQTDKQINVSVILLAMFMGYVIIKMSTSNNDIVNNINTLLKKFTGEDIVSKITNYLSFAIMITVITYSVVTNYYTYSEWLTDKAGVYICSVIFDIMAIWYSLVADKYEKLDFSESYYTKIYPFAEDENVSIERVKNVSKDLHVQERKIVSNDGKKVICDMSQEDKIEDENVSKDLHIPERTSVTKEIKTQAELERVIDELEDGTVLSPKLFNLQGNKSYYNWVRQCKNVKRVENRYVKQKQNNVFTIVPKQKRGVENE